MPFGERVPEALQVLDLDVFMQVLSVELRHVENLQHVLREVHERGAHDFPRFLFRDGKPPHHLAHGKLALLLDDHIIEPAEQRAEEEQRAVRQEAQRTAQRHQRVVEHEHSPAVFRL